MTVILSQEVLLVKKKFNFLSRLEFEMPEGNTPLVHRL